MLGGSVAPSKPSLLEKFARITQAVSGISLIVGVCLGLVQIYNIAASQKAGAESQRVAAKSAKLAGLSTVNKIIEEDQAIQKITQDFIFTQGYNNEKIMAVVQQYGTARAAYRSDELAEMSAIGHHYEQLGALVKLDYIDFPLVYEIVPFPEDFWDATEGFRNEARTHWDQNRGLDDFWSNFGTLKRQYECMRSFSKAHPHAVATSETCPAEP
jgi:hypothetical protein